MHSAYFKYLRACPTLSSSFTQNHLHKITRTCKNSILSSSNNTHASWVLVPSRPWALKHQSRRGSQSRDVGADILDWHGVVELSSGLLSCTSGTGCWGQSIWPKNRVEGGLAFGSFIMSVDNPLVEWQFSALSTSIRVSCNSWLTNFGVRTGLTRRVPYQKIPEGSSGGQGATLFWELYLSILRREDFKNSHHAVRTVPIPHTDPSLVGEISPVLCHTPSCVLAGGVWCL